MAIRSLFSSIRFYLTAHRVIVRHRLWPYMILPGLMSFGFFLTLIGIGGAYFGDISTHMYQNYFPGFLKWEFLLTVTTILLWLLLFLTGYVLYQPVVLILFSPVLGYLSEVTERRVFGGPGAPFHLRQLMKDIFRGLTLSLRNVVRMILMIGLAWLMILIPIVGAVLSAGIIFLVQAYFNGCTLADYTLERKNYSVKDRVRFARTHRLRVTGMGIGFMLVLFIPLLGWFAAPAYGTVASTLSTLAAIQEKAGASPSAEGDAPAPDPSRPPE